MPSRTEVRLEGNLILTESERGRLLDSLPRSSFDVALARLLAPPPSPLEPDDVAALYSFLDVSVRDLIEDAWYATRDPHEAPEPPVLEIVERAKVRLVSAFPWLMDYLLGPCEGCAYEAGLAYEWDGGKALAVTRQVHPGETCSFCGSEIARPRTCAHCGATYVRGPETWGRSSTCDLSRLCPHCGKP